MYQFDPLALSYADHQQTDIQLELVGGTSLGDSANCSGGVTDDSVLAMLFKGNNSDFPKFEYAAVEPWAMLFKGNNSDFPKFEYAAVEPWAMLCGITDVHFPVFEYAAFASHVQFDSFALSYADHQQTDIQLELVGGTSLGDSANCSGGVTDDSVLAMLCDITDVHFPVFEYAAFASHRDLYGSEIVQGISPGTVGENANCSGGVTDDSVLTSIVDMFLSIGGSEEREARDRKADKGKRAIYYEDSY